MIFLQNINLTVSDRRKNILENLGLRFTKAGIKDYNLIVADLQLPSSASALVSNLFDLIIADVPCTGSGTWARTPEQLTFFHQKDIDKYAAIQRKIIENAISAFKEQRDIFYISPVRYLKKKTKKMLLSFNKNFRLNLLRMEYLKGYEMQADTLFVALLTPECTVVVTATTKFKALFTLPITKFKAVNSLL